MHISSPLISNRKHRRGTLHNEHAHKEPTIAPNVALMSKLAMQNALQSQPLDWHLYTYQQHDEQLTKCTISDGMLTFAKKSIKYKENFKQSRTKMHVNKQPMVCDAQLTTYKPVS